MVDRKEHNDFLRRRRSPASSVGERKKRRSATRWFELIDSSVRRRVMHKARRYKDRPSYYFTKRIVRAPTAHEALAKIQWTYVCQNNYHRDKPTKRLPTTRPDENQHRRKPSQYFIKSCLPLFVVPKSPISIGI